MMMMMMMMMMQAFDLMKDYLSGVIEHSGKMVILMEIIEQCVRLQEKILIFRYQFTVFTALHICRRSFRSQRCLSVCLSQRVL